VDLQGSGRRDRRLSNVAEHLLANLTCIQGG
jgi:hypothetical protein